MPLYHTSIMENLPAVLTFIAMSLVVIIGSFLLFGALKQRKQHAVAMQLMTTRLTEALRRNCRVFVRRQGKGRQVVEEVEIRPESMDSGRLIFTASPGAFDAEARGREMSLFLYYKQDMNYQYYTLTGKLTHLEQSPAGQRGLFVLAPVLHEDQRRRFLRVSPPGFMCTINRVHYAPAGANTSDELMTMSTDAVTLGDISSGGVRLHVNSTFGGYRQLNKGDVILLNVTFINRDASMTTMDIAGTCLNVLSVPVNGPTPSCKALCVMFQRLSIPDPRNGRNVWIPVDQSSGIPGLHNWILQVQMACRGT